MAITRTVALSLAALATAGGLALAAPAVAGAEPARTPAATQSTGSWLITVKRATYPTLQAERDRVMHDAERAGWTTTLRCTTDADECLDSFVVTGPSYRTIVTRYRYDDAIVAITAAD